MLENANISLQKDVLHILNELEAQGYEAYLVGGYVRDFLLGKCAGDCDVTTNALPEEIKAVFLGERTVDTGIKHGTVTVIYNGNPYEITTYRVDGNYNDNRHPDSVGFTSSLEEDLARRDFTVNAMAYSERRGIVDLFCGREDLKMRLIRAVGEPSRRFTEDALRIIRALRFASVLDFEVEEATRVSIFEHKERLRNISAERIFAELKKLLRGVGAHRVISEFSAIFTVILCGLDRIVLPDRRTFDNLTPEERLITIFALSSPAPAETFRTAMNKLKSDRKTSRFGFDVLSALSEGCETETAELILTYGIEPLRTAMLLRARLYGNTDGLSCIEKIIEENLPLSITELKINGNDVLSVGKRGAEVGEILKAAFGAVIRGEIKNDREELIKFIKS